MTEGIDRVRGIIIQNELVLLIYRVKHGRNYWVFPGGGVESGDAGPHEALKRECREELSLEVEVAPAEALRVTWNGESNVFYCCRVLGGKLAYGDGPEFSRPESGTFVFAWVPIGQITNLDSLFPEQAKNYVAENKSIISVDSV